MTHVSRTILAVLFLLLVMGAGTGVLFFQKRETTSPPSPQPPIVRVAPIRKPVPDRLVAMQPGAPLQPLPSPPATPKVERPSASDPAPSGRTGRRSGMRALGIPSISTIPDQDMVNDEEAVSVRFLVMDANTPLEDIKVSVVSQNTKLLPQEAMTPVCENGACVLTLLPAENQMGHGVVVVSVHDGMNEAKTSFTLRVLDPVAPFISLIPGVVVPAGKASGPIPFVMDDLETDPDFLSLEVMSSHPELVMPEDVLLEGGGRNRTLSFTPRKGVYGTLELTLVAGDDSGEIFLRSIPVSLLMPAVSQSIARPQASEAGVLRDPAIPPLPDRYGHLPENHPVRQRMRR